MGCGSSKTVPVDASDAPASEPVTANSADAAAAAAAAAASKKADTKKVDNKKADPKGNKKDAKNNNSNSNNNNNKPAKKAEAFEVDVGDVRSGSGKAPPRFAKAHKKSITAEDVEAKLRAAEERRQAHQVDQISRIKEHTERVDIVKTGVQEGAEIKRKSDNPHATEQRKDEIRKQVQAKSRARHREAIENASKLDE